MQQPLHLKLGVLCHVVKALSNVCFSVHVCSSNTVLLLGIQPVEDKGVFHLGEQKH